MLHAFDLHTGRSAHLLVARLAHILTSVFLCSLFHFSDGSLDKLEFKAALSAMSIPVKDDAALQALLDKVAGSGATKVSREQYVAFVTELNTDKDTPEQIVAAFRTLADDKDTIVVDQLRVPPLSQEDVEYLASEMQKNEESGGLDYQAFVKSAFVQQQ
jgi:Ca2+-binding EF-hand superfamily protein